MFRNIVGPTGPLSKSTAFLLAAANGAARCFISPVNAQAAARSVAAGASRCDEHFRTACSRRGGGRCELVGSRHWYVQPRLAPGVWVGSDRMNLRMFQISASEYL